MIPPTMINPLKIVRYFSNNLKDEFKSLILFLDIRSEKFGINKERNVFSNPLIIIKKLENTIKIPNNSSSQYNKKNIGPKLERRELKTMGRIKMKLRNIYSLNNLELKDLKRNILP